MYANVRHVANNTGEFSKKEQLRKPFRIIVTKSDIHINYPLRYLGVRQFCAQHTVEARGDDLCACFYIHGSSCATACVCHSTLQSVNNNPQEWWVEVWNPILGIAACNDRGISQNGGDTSRASCNHQRDRNGHVISDSQVETAWECLW